MTTILIPSGKSFTAPEDIVFPIVTTVVPDSASASDISVVAKADLAKVFPVKTIERFVEKDNALYTGDIAPSRSRSSPRQERPLRSFRA